MKPSSCLLDDILVQRITGISGSLLLMAVVRVPADLRGQPGAAAR